MSEHPQNDYLSRALARRQIDEDQYEIGRIWQALFRKAQSGEQWASNTLDAWWINAQAVKNFVSGNIQWDDTARGASTYKELLCDVLGALEPGYGLPSLLAQAAAKRGLNPATGSRDMKRLGKIIRGCLFALSRSFDSLVRSFDERQRENVRHYLDRRRFGGASLNLAGVEVSTAAGDKFEARLERVRKLALTSGFKIGPAPEPGLFYLETLRGVDALPVDCSGISLATLEALLLRLRIALKSPAVPRRKRGARGQPAITMPVFRSIQQDKAKRVAEEIDEQKRRLKIDRMRKYSRAELRQVLACPDDVGSGGAWEALLKSVPGYIKIHQ